MIDFEVAAALEVLRLAGAEQLGRLRAAGFDDETANVILRLRAAGFYVSSTGRTNSDGAAEILGIKPDTLEKWRREETGKAPRSYQPGGTKGARYYDVVECVRRARLES